MVYRFTSAPVASRRFPVDDRELSGKQMLVHDYHAAAALLQGDFRQGRARPRSDPHVPLGSNAFIATAHATTSILNLQPVEIIMDVHGKGGRSIKNEKF
jgi:hypothetical protein